MDLQEFYELTQALDKENRALVRERLTRDPNEKVTMAFGFDDDDEPKSVIFNRELLPDIALTELVDGRGDLKGALLESDFRWPIDILAGDLALLDGNIDEAKAKYKDAVASIQGTSLDVPEAAFQLGLEYLLRGSGSSDYGWDTVRSHWSVVGSSLFEDDSFLEEVGDAVARNKLREELLSHAADAFRSFLDVRPDHAQWLLGMHTLVWLAEERKHWDQLAKLCEECLEVTFNSYGFESEMTADIAWAGQRALRALEENKERLAIKLTSQQWEETESKLRQDFKEVGSLPPIVLQKLATADALYQFIQKDTPLDWTCVSIEYWGAAEIYFREGLLPQLRLMLPALLAECLTIKRGRGLSDVLKEICGKFADIRVEGQFMTIRDDVIRIACTLDECRPERNKGTHEEARPHAGAERLRNALRGDPRDKKQGIIKDIALVLQRVGS